MKKITNRVGRAGDIRTYSGHGEDGDVEVLKVKIIKTRKEKCRYTGDLGTKIGNTKELFVKYILGTIIILGSV